jgi:hypothetical protein
MWKRKLLLASLMLLGLAVIAATMLEVEPDQNEIQAAVGRYQHATELDQSVERVNAAFRQAWENELLTPAPPADSLLLARRLSLGLTGTVPSLEEIRHLETLPETEQMQWHLEHLLTDRRSSDYLAERLARMYVGVDDGPFLVYRRRRFVTWLSDQIQENRPYDQLARELIADRGLWTDSPAVNFVTVTLDSNEDGQPDPIRLAARTTRAFLGVRLDCVQCHDDFLNARWEQQDFHHLAAFFAPTKQNFVVGIIDDDSKTYEYRLHEDIEPQKLTAKVPFNDEFFEEGGTRRQRLARWVTHKENRPFARTIVNRTWALMFGRPLIDPVDNIPLEGPYPPGLEALADDLIAHDFNLRRLFRVIALSEPFARDSRAAEGEPLTQAAEDAWAVFPLTRLRPEQVAGAVLQSASLETIDADSHLITKAVRFGQENEFVKRYGDTGEDEFVDRGGTIPQRLLMLNGNLVAERTKGDNIMLSAAARIARLSSSKEKAVEIAYLTILSRQPTPHEQEHFVKRLEENKLRGVQDLTWTLMNSTEFSWNH